VALEQSKPMPQTKTSKTASVRIVTGNRKLDLSEFQGLKFEGPNHSDFFLTPGQLLTVLKLQEEAKKLVSEMPRLPKRKR
jgi:hypothetical protein